MLADPGYRAVIFDFFGTLTHAVQRGPWHFEIARTLGCDPDEFLDLLDRSFLNRCRGRYGSAEATLRWVCDQLGASPSKAQLRTACAHRIAAIRADTTLRPEALPTLRALRRSGLRTAVVSDCGHELPEFLPTLPVAELLDTAVYSVHLGVSKPHPDMYLAACGRLGIRPEEGLYVGDGGSRELTGARAVGLDPVMLAAPDLHRHLTFAAERDWSGRVIDSLAEISALVGRGALD